MTTLADRLRQSAQELRTADGPPPDDVQVDGVLLTSIPNGLEHQIRVIWHPARSGRSPRLSIRLWREVAPNRFNPCRDIGIEVLAFRLPALAEAVAAGLELAQQAQGSPEKARAR